jgi:hypothetical protein
MSRALCEAGRGAAATCEDEADDEVEGAEAAA